MKEKTNWRDVGNERCFRAGTLNGVGFSNIILANLPGYVLKLLAIAGLSGDRMLGRKSLMEALEIPNQPRYQLTSVIIMVLNMYLSQHLGIGEGDIDWAEETGERLLKNHPNGGFVKFLNARAQLLKSKPKRAIQLYEDCLALKSSWKQIDLFCYFDLIWSHAILSEWQKAAFYALKLKENCTWGHAINMHQVAVFKIMQKFELGHLEVDEEIIQAMEQVPKLRKRYCGKSFPMEKFAVERALQFLAEVEKLNPEKSANPENLQKIGSELKRPKTSPLPVYELFYVWNIFSMTANDSSLLEPILENLELNIRSLAPLDLSMSQLAESRQWERRKSDFRPSTSRKAYERQISAQPTSERKISERRNSALISAVEERCRLLFLKGVCCKFLRRFEEAIECFEFIVTNESMLGKSYLVPHSFLELGLVYRALKCNKEARVWIEKARARSKYLLEALIQMKAHGVLRQMDSEEC